MTKFPSAADLEAAHAFIGCETAGCPWEGVVEVQFGNSFGPKWRACREHAAPYRHPGPDINPDEYAVRDSGRHNRKLLVRVEGNPQPERPETPRGAQGPNFNATVTELVAKKLEEQLRSPLPHLNAGLISVAEARRQVGLDA